jgi:hypothetical protein
MTIRLEIGMSLFMHPEAQVPSQRGTPFVALSVSVRGAVATENCFLPISRNGHGIWYLAASKGEPTPARSPSTAEVHATQPLDPSSRRPTPLLARCPWVPLDKPEPLQCAVPLPSTSQVQGCADEALPTSRVGQARTQAPHLLEP